MKYAIKILKSEQEKQRQIQRNSKDNGIIDYNIRRDTKRRLESVKKAIDILSNIPKDKECRLCAYFTYPDFCECRNSSLFMVNSSMFCDKFIRTATREAQE
jgi:hypothetical protein